MGVVQPPPHVTVMLLYLYPNALLVEGNAILYREPWHLQTNMVWELAYNEHEHIFMLPMAVFHATREDPPAPFAPARNRIRPPLYEYRSYMADRASIERDTG